MALLMIPVSQFLGLKTEYSKKKNNPSKYINIPTLMFAYISVFDIALLIIVIFLQRLTPSGNPSCDAAGVNGRHQN